MKYIRYLESSINDTCFSAGKMAFISGPRQCGKTTMAKQLLKERGTGEYYNWDESKFRRQWVKDPSALLPPLSHSSQKKPVIILDELHKAKLWKRTLKGLYDTRGAEYDILVTGSARLNVYRKGSDSLMGRYYHFRLHPFSVAELLNGKYTTAIETLITHLFSKPKIPTHSEHHLKNLYRFGPFPEPLLAASDQVSRLWKKGRLEKIIREDLRDISRLPELSQVEMLASLLPDRVAQPLSIKSLSEDLEVAYTTVKRWLQYLNELYYFFDLKPYSKSYARSIKKETKLYLWDWSEVENKGARFENLVAGHLLKYCHYLNDLGLANVELKYLKDKEKNEIDFLITKDKKPFLPIEIKLNDKTPSNSWSKFMKHLGCEYGIQVVMEPGVYEIYSYPLFKILVISASIFLPYLV